MLHGMHPLFILGLLLTFMAPIYGVEVGRAIGLSVRIEHSYIKQCTVQSAPPEASGTNIQSRLRVTSGGSAGEGLEIGRASCRERV